MDKFSVGTRVKVYGFRPKWQGQPEYQYSRKDKGIVESIVNNDEIVVKFDDGTYGEVHPKQCRKLVKKS